MARMVGATQLPEEIVLAHMKKSLIINADDLGLTSGTNKAIIACHNAGSVSSATMMVNMPATEEALVLAKNNPDLGVGLHFNLSCGNSLCQADKVRSLVDLNGEFHQRGVAEKKAIFGQLHPADVQMELEAQWDFMHDNELVPTHIDSHQHIHVFPTVFDVVARFCVEKHLPMRVPKPWRPPSDVPFKRRVRMLMLNWMIRRNMNKWNGKLMVNGSFASIFDFQMEPKDITTKNYRDILLVAHDSPLELMVHPADVDLEHAEMTDISEVSRRDFEIFSRQNFGDIAQELGYDLINYAKLKR